MYLKKTLLVFILALTLSSISCKKEKLEETVFEKSSLVKEDATKVWLRKNVNYKKDKDHYFKVFYNYYQDKINSKKYDDASKILDVITTKFVYFYDFDPKLTKIVNEFNSKYRSKLEPIKTLFVDNYYGNLEFDLDNIEKAKEYLLKITAFEPIDYKSCLKIARAHYDLSYAYFILGDISNSIKANEKSRIYSIKIGDDEGVASTYVNYINIYKANGSFEKAIEYADKAIAIFKKNNNTYDYFMSKYNKCNVYGFFDKNIEKNKAIHQTYKEYIESNFDSDVLLLCISDYEIEALVQENKMEEAKKALDKIKITAAVNPSQNWQNDYQATLALYEIKKDPINCNVTYIKNALPNLLKNKNYERANLFYNVLLNKAIVNKDFEKALYYTQEAFRTKDSLTSVLNAIKNSELALTFETKKKEQKIALQEKTINYNNTIIALLVSLFIGLFLTVLIFFTLQKQKKLKIEKQRNLLFTKQLLETTEEERKRIASDLHDSVSHELLGLKNIFESKAEIVNQKIDAIINDIRAISRNLHPVMFEKIGLKASIEQLVEKTQTSNNFVVTSDIEYSGSLSSAVELQIYRIVQETLTNIIKHANAFAAKITLYENENSLFFEIKDNGKGFNVSEKLKSKQAFGLHNVIERSRAINGESKIYSCENGTVITIEIKKQS